MTFRVRKMGPRFTDRNLANASLDADMMFGQGSGNFLIDGADGVGQAVYTRLLLFQGEWFLDLKAGMPWLQQILGHSPNLNTDMAIRECIHNTPHVTNIYDYLSAYDSSSRLFLVSCKIQTAFGPVTNAPVGAAISTSGALVMPIRMPLREN